LAIRLGRIIVLVLSTIVVYYAVFYLLTYLMGSSTLHFGGTAITGSNFAIISAFFIGVAWLIAGYWYWLKE
jgi:hypothetical protein